jgi:hypothetical protein
LSGRPLRVGGGVDEGDECDGQEQAADHRDGLGEKVGR